MNTTFKNSLLTDFMVNLAIGFGIGAFLGLIF